MPIYLYFIFGLFFLGGVFCMMKMWRSDKFSLVFLLLTILPGMLGRYTTEPKGGTAILLTDVVVLCIVGLWMARKIIQKELVSQHILFKLLFAFCGILILSWISGLLVIYFTGGIEGKEFITSFMYLGRYIFYACIGLITFDSIKKRGDLDFWMKIFSLIFFGVILGGFIQRIFWPDFFQFFVLYGWDPHQDRLLGSFFDPNFIGSFLAMNILLFLSLVLHGSKRKGWYILLILLGVVALALTLSRSAYLAFVIGFIFLTALRARWLLVTGLITMVLVVANVPTILDRISQGVSVDESSQKHVESWHTAWEIFRAYPVLGVGYNHLGTVQEDLSLVDEWDVNNRSGFENSFLSVAVYSGFVGLFFFLFFWGAFLVHSFRSVFDRRLSRFEQGLSLGIATSIIVSVVSALLINTLFFAFVLVELWMMLGMIVKLNTRNEKLEMKN